MKIYLKEIKGHNFAEGVKGIGTCGVSFDQNGYFNGYIYANDGYGNAETYYEVDAFLKLYPELENLVVEVTFDKNNEIVSLMG